MAGQTEYELTIAWKALSSGSDGAEWKLIPVRQPSTFTAHAARRFPQDLEALVIGFPSAVVSSTRKLPEGGGFEVMRSKSDDDGLGRSAIALVRNPSGPLDIFHTMASDILALLDRNQSLSPPTLVDRFLDRVVAWQLFMQPPRNGPLGPDAQTGLFGELCFMRRLLDRNMPGVLAVGAWDGPLHGAQDYRIGPGAVEVKSSTAVEGFNAKIQSLEQLDDTECSPLFLLALRFAEDPRALTLPELVAELRERLADEGARAPFDGKLLAVGYHDDHAGAYARRLALTEERAFRVGPGFPRLFRGNIAAPVHRAAYEIEIDGVEAGLADQDALFQELGLE